MRCRFPKKKQFCFELPAILRNHSSPGSDARAFCFGWKTTKEMALVTATALAPPENVEKFPELLPVLPTKKRERSTSSKSQMDLFTLVEILASRLIRRSWNRIRRRRHRLPSRRRWQLGRCGGGGGWCRRWWNGGWSWRRRRRRIVRSLWC